MSPLSLLTLLGIYLLNQTRTPMLGSPPTNNFATIMKPRWRKRKRRKRDLRVCWVTFILHSIFFWSGGSLSWHRCFCRWLSVLSARCQRGAWERARVTPPGSVAVEIRADTPRRHVGLGGGGRKGPRERRALREPKNGRRGSGSYTLNSVTGQKIYIKQNLLTTSVWATLGSNWHSHLTHTQGQET